jgi:DNA-binding SARP family transcriptional activator
VWLEGKFLKPIASRTDSLYPGLRDRANGRIVFVETPSGYLLTNQLVAILESDTENIAWLRLGPEETDPASCLYSLIAAIQECRPQFGLQTLEQLGRSLASFCGWSEGYACLARELGGSVQTPLTIVVEHLHNVSPSSLTLRLLGQPFLSNLPDRFRVVLTSQEKIPDYIFHESACRVGVADLQLEAPDTYGLFEQSGLHISYACARRLTELTQGKAVTLTSLGCAAHLLGESCLERSLVHLRHPNDLFDEISGLCLETLPPDDLAAANILAFLGYYHPALSSGIPADAAFVSEPWTQSLDKSWLRPFRIWRGSLRKVLRSHQAYDPALLCAAAELLCQDTSWLNGIDILFELGCMQKAARQLTQHASTLLGAGMWETVTHWLQCIPPALLREEPWLMQTSAELKALVGDPRGAMLIFHQAYEQFRSRNDQLGVCTSLLASATLAAWLGDLGSAMNRVDEALYIARAAGLVWQQAWAEFQLACLCIRMGNRASVTSHLLSAAELASQAKEPCLQEMVNTLTTLVADQQRLQSQRSLQQQAYYETRRLERSVNAEVRLAALYLQETHAHALPACEWLHIPLGLKTPYPPQFVKIPARSTSNRWQAWLHRLLPGKATAAPAPVRARLDAGALFRLAGFSPPVGEQVPMLAGLSILGGVPAPAASVTAFSSTQANSTRPDTTPTGKTFTAYMLGSFRFTLQDQPVAQPPGGRGGMLFKYLVCHHRRQVPREQLMELFWPQADPEMARNRLNVTLNSLRQALRQVTPAEIVIFEDGKYALDPSWVVWLDMDEFERQLELARHLEAGGEAQPVIQALEAAANLYQGDFLQDDPYEEWTILIRERLRLAYLDALYQLTGFYFQQGQFAACSTLCKTILEHDRCREDVHCLLMRCYARQDQVPLALRQYQACVEALRQELDVEPGDETNKLAECIQKRIFPLS